LPEFMDCSFVQNGIAVDDGSATLCDTIGLES
jgi:hypothetical protein